MDKIREDRLMHYRRAEKIIQDIEEKEAKKNEAIRLLQKTDRTSIGPANDLLRFLYILNQQYQSDSPEIRAKSTEDLQKYMDQFRSADSASEDKDEEEEEAEDDNNQQPQELRQSTPTVSVNPQPTTVLLQPKTVATSPPYVSILVPVSQPPPPPPPPTPSQIPKPATNDPGYITPDTQLRYAQLSSRAEEYEKRYSTVDAARKKMLAGPLKNIINRLREETFKILTDELLNFLNGQEQKVLNQSIRIANDDERLLCLSMLASLIFRQLLDGDLNDVQKKILPPLVGLLSGNERHREFQAIFLDRLHKKCPYTVPLYPKREASMSDEQYYEGMGYVMKKDGDQVRLENETEFLNRMSGLIRFFCKLLVRRGPPFDNKLTYAWAWMADVLNLPPRPQITALIIRIFLDEAGQSMIKEYSGQFEKILHTIQRQYLPRLEKETTADQMTRLRLILETLMKKS